MVQVLFLIGRIILGVFYLFNAVNHLTRLDEMSRWAASKGVPAARVLVVVTGAMLLVGGLTVLLGVYPAVGVAALTVFFVPVTFWMHDFWAVQDPLQRVVQMVNFTKNLALLASAWILLAVPQPWPLSLAR
ncbi:MAG: DoxX family membrane protein [Armatimonadota bacterium]|nr:DoxX family membrane protein [Armatimonadota bacterium]